MINNYDFYLKFSSDDRKGDRKWLIDKQQKGRSSTVLLRLLYIALNHKTNDGAQIKKTYLTVAALTLIN